MPESITLSKTIRLRKTLTEVKRELRAHFQRPEIRILLLSRTAHHLLTKIHEAYLVKSTGRADELGQTWKPLSPSTSAYHPALRSDKPPRHHKRSSLSPRQDRLWRGIYAHNLTRLIASGVPVPTAQVKAAQIAWGILKSRGARTWKDRNAGKQAPILLRSGRLERSFRAPHLTPNTLRPYNRDQSITITDRSLTFGTRVPYAPFQDRTRKLIPPASRMEPWIVQALRHATAQVRDRIAEDLR